MEWLRINRNLPAHPKSKALARALGEEVSWWRIAQVWAWCIEFAQNGRIETPDAVLDIEDAAGWTVPVRERGAFVAACVRVKFLDKTDKGYAVHDWAEHNGAALLLALKAAKRARKWRDKKKKERTTTNANRTHTKRIRNANRTGNTTTPHTTPPHTTKSIDLEAGAAAPPDPDLAVYLRWRELYAPRAAEALTDKRRKLIQSRRAERPPARAQQDLLDSLGGWRFDPWAGRRDQVDLELLLRDAGHVDKGLALLPAFHGLDPPQQSTCVRHPDRPGLPGTVPLVCRECALQPVEARP